MTTIKNRQELSDEIKRMKLVIEDKESLLRNDLDEIYHSMLPSIMLTTAIKRIRSDIKGNWWNSVTWKAVQGGLLVWTGHLLYKVKNRLERNLLGIIDKPFDKLKALTGRKS